MDSLCCCVEKTTGMIFPLTGYAPMDVQSWEKVFLTARITGSTTTGSTCCPASCIVAADEVGMYLEPELPFWGTIVAEGGRVMIRQDRNF